MPFRIAFDQPLWLLLLVVLPPFWWWSWRRLALLGRLRGTAALVLRTLVIVTLVAALAEIQWQRTSDRVTVLYLLDQSASIPQQARQQMLEFTNRSIDRHRQGDDRVGVIVFGREAAVEAPPFDDDIQLPGRVESPVDRDFTNLAAAMRLAEASFPEDASRRIVIVSDGNENLGNARDMGEHLSQSPVGIDVVLVNTPPRSDVMLERLAVPSNLRQGQPFDLKVLLSNRSLDGEPVSGRLVVKRRRDGEPVVVADEPVELGPGLQAFSIRQRFDASGFYSYEATFLPDDPQADAVPQNNQATGFAQVRGQGRVLVIEDAQMRGRLDRFVRAVESRNFEVTLRNTDQSFTSLAELAAFDAVVLGNVPREAFTDSQITMLVQNTQQAGAGLIMLGGENGFAAGGWSNTELEKAMPVDFQIDNLEVVPRGALAMVMHASEIPQGNYWQVRIGEEALRSLGPRDYCGVIQYDMRGTSWLWRGGMLEVGPRRNQMVAMIRRMTPGDMPEFDPGLKLAAQGFASVPDAAVKHMIVISDGDPAPPSQAAINALVQTGATVSTVAVGAHGPAGSRRLQRLAVATGGKYYQVNDASALVRIYQREARRVAMPVIYEADAPFAVDRTGRHEILSGTSSGFAQIAGFVMTRLKPSPLVEAPLIASQPGPRENCTILATWQYGLGRSVAFTADAGARWLDPAGQWGDYERFFGQLAAWAARPTESSGNYTVATRLEDGNVRVIVNALDPEDRFINFAQMIGTVISPDLDSKPLELKQIGPGRYEAVFPAEDSGDYLVTVLPGAGEAPLNFGMTIPYSEEYRYRPANRQLLESLARLTPEGGTAGVLSQADADFANLEELLAVNHFRHDLAKVTTERPVWHLFLLVAAWLFVADIFVRRVQVDYLAVMRRAGQRVAQLLGREPPAPEPVTIQRLRSRKAAVAEELKERAAARFEPPPEVRPPKEEPVTPEAKPGRRPESTAEEPAEGGEPDADRSEYTERLLELKRRMWKGKRPPDKQ